MAEVHEEKQEFIPGQETSVLPQYLDNINKETEGDLVHLPFSQDDSFKIQEIRREEIKDFNDEGQSQAEADLNQKLKKKRVTAKPRSCPGLGHFPESDPDPD